MQIDPRRDPLSYGTPCFLLEEFSTKGMFTLIDSDLPRLQQGELVRPLQQRGEDSGVYSFKLTLSSPDKEMAMSASNDASLWHRRMVHLNAQSLDVLNHTADNHR